jgi:hypothetical protein
MLGLAATCNAGGATKQTADGKRRRSKWRPELNSFFRGRDVIVLPDNDDAGRDHACAVAANLARVATSVRILELPHLPPKGDVSDWLAEGGTRERLEEFAIGAPVFEAQQTHEDHGRKASVNGWYRKCLVGAKGQVLGNLSNALLALRQDETWRGVLAYDEMLRTAMLMRPVPEQANPAFVSFTPRPVRDEDASMTQEWLQIAGLPTIGKDTTHQAVDLIAREHSFHPVKQYLDGLVWDGTSRLTVWLLPRCGGYRLHKGHRPDVRNQPHGPDL